MLTKRQLETLAHLKRNGYETPQQVIAWCNLKAGQPRYSGKRKDRTASRNHSIKYYVDIIDFLR